MTNIGKKYGQAPCNEQTAIQVEGYYRNVNPGDAAIIRCTQGHFLEYTVDVVVDINAKRGRIYLERGDAWGGRAWYAKNGKSCFHPGSQSNLVVPTDKIYAWIKEHPRGVMTYDVEYNIAPPGQRSGDGL